jgi:hypothetical protein
LRSCEGCSRTGGTQLNRTTREGGLIIRTARPGESSIALPSLAPDGERAPGHRVPLRFRTPTGPRFAWDFPARWVETFFPLQYESGPHDFLPIARSWSLADLLDQQGGLTLSLDCSNLYLILQRTSPAPGILDIHLIPGLLHLMGWTPETPLILESLTGFDPRARSDALTIRQTRSTRSPALAWDGLKRVARVKPSWLKRLLPRHYDPSSADESPGVDDWFDWDDATLERPDTAVVGFRDLNIHADALAFNVTLPADPF